MAKLFVALMLCLSAGVAIAGDPTLFFDWTITYGTKPIVGEVILINGEFPGPKINATSNNNIIINVHNNLDEPFLLTWNGVQHRKNSWQDGTLGTMCPIAPGTNYTYKFQVKDQIGTFFYFPTTGLQRASGGIGMLKVHSRALIPIPFDLASPADEFEVLLGDWYRKGHKTLKKLLDSGRSIGRPDGVLIHGASIEKPLYTMEPGKTYRYRVCNVGLRTSVNFRIQNHPLKLVEIEGSHTVQNMYDSLDIHVGQCLSVLVKADKEPKEYVMYATPRFIKNVKGGSAFVGYSNAKPLDRVDVDAVKPPPENTAGIAWSINQFRSFRWNLTASAARPNPQGSYLYGKINITRTIVLRNSRAIVDGKLRFTINNVSHVDKETPLKLAEYFGKQPEVFKYDLAATATKAVIEPNVLNATWKEFVEIIFENREKTIQSYHLDGHSFFAVAIEPGRWAPEKRKNYNLLDAVSRNTIQVYPNSWAAIMLTFDNAGMWNLRSDMMERTYLGQQMYVSLLSPGKSTRDEYNIPETQLICGVAQGAPKPTPYT